MNYLPKKGIVLVKICDAYLLIPTRAASESCPGIASISGFEAILWRQMEKGAGYEDLLDLLSKFTMQPKEEAALRLEPMLKRLLESGFLAEEDAPC